MKKYKKIIISLGTIIIGLTPIITAVSCSNDNYQWEKVTPSQKTDKGKMDGITSIMVKNTLGIIADPTQFVDNVVHPDSKIVTINGLKNVTITISSWTGDDVNGIINFVARVKKNDLAPPKSPFNIEISGFKKMTLQDILDRLSKIKKDAIQLGKSALTIPYIASNPKNAKWITTHINTLSPVYKYIMYNLSYTGPLKIGYNNIVVSYNGKFTYPNFTIPVEVNQT